MVQFVDNLATYLQTQGHGTLGTNLFKGNAPDAADDLIVVTDTGGLPNSLNDGGSANTSTVETITVQILARNKRQEVARDKLLAIQTTLHKQGAINLGTYTIINALAIDRPGLLGRDQKERWTLVVNYEFLTRLS
jgi:hypothetical protein